MRMRESHALTRSQSRAGETFDSSSTREERLSRMWIGRKVRGVDEKRHIKRELCGRARECSVVGVLFVN